MSHYEESAFVDELVGRVFDYVDDPVHLSAHMSGSSRMLGGGGMEIETDIDHGRAIGSHIRMSGTVLGIHLELDEVVTHYEPPHRKVWQTVGTPRLLVIGHYRMGFEITAEDRGSRLRVFIDYDLPETWRTRWVGYVFGGTYARWCVRQMIESARKGLQVPVPEAVHVQ